MIETKNRNILIIGSSGLVGSAFMDHLGIYNTAIESFVNVKGAIRRIFTPTHLEFDITALSGSNSFLTDYKIGTVINFAAFRDANEAEKERGKMDGVVWQTNAVAPGLLARACDKVGAHLIHISTDMVFAGKDKLPRLYHEDDPVDIDQNGADLSWYGYSKAVGESEVSYTNARFSIMRISNVIKPIDNEALDYTAKLVSLAKQGKSIFYDQRVTVSYLPQLNQAILALIDGQTASGIYHIADSLTGPGDRLSPAELTKYVLICMEGHEIDIQTSSLADYLNIHPNRYPLNGGLSGTRTNHLLGLEPLTWRQIGDRYVEMTKKNK